MCAVAIHIDSEGVVADSNSDTDLHSPVDWSLIPHALLHVGEVILNTCLGGSLWHATGR